MVAPPNSPARPLSETPDIEAYSALSLGTPVHKTTPAVDKCPTRVASPARPVEGAPEIEDYEPFSHVAPTEEVPLARKENTARVASLARPLEEAPEIEDYEPHSLVPPVGDISPAGLESIARVASPARPLEEAPEIRDYRPSSFSIPGEEEHLGVDEYHSPEIQIATPARPLEEAPDLDDYEPMSLDEAPAEEHPSHDPRTPSLARPPEETSVIEDCGLPSLAPDVRLVEESSTSDSKTFIASPARPLEEAPEIENYERLSLDVPVTGEVLNSGSRVASPARPLEEAPEIENYQSLSPEVPLTKHKPTITRSNYLQATTTDAISHDQLGQSYNMRPGFRFQLHPSVELSDSNDGDMAPLFQHREDIASRDEASDNKAATSRGYTNTFLSYCEAQNQHRLRNQIPAANRIQASCEHGNQRGIHDSGEGIFRNLSNGDRELIAELRQNTQNQGELITELKIRVAVLENDLKHTEKQRDEALHTSAVMTKVLGSAVSSPRSDADKEERDDLARENKMLKRENAVLWKRLESRQVKRAVNFTDSSTSDEDLLHGHGIRKFSCSESKGKNIESSPSTQRRGKTSNGALVKTPSFATSASILMATPIARALNAKERSRSSNPWESFESVITTVPNSPLVSPLPETHSSQTLPSANPVLQPDVELYTPTLRPPNQHINAGLESLEDVLGSDMDGFPPPLRAELQPLGQVGATRAKLLNHDSKGIDVDLQEQMEFTAKLENLPTPGVLKTGFDLSGSFRGYDHDAKRPRSFQSGHLPTRDYNRFASVPLTRDNTSSSEPSGSSTSFEYPKDRSQSTKLWSSAEQRESAIDINRRTSALRESRASPDFFRYGIQFVPVESDTNYLRTVVITNLPQYVDLRELLARVRGGDIISAILMNTISITGSMSAMVQFLQEGLAEDYVEFVKEHPLKFPSSSQLATATLLSTPTWPLSIPSVRRIRENHQSRLLSVPNFPETISLSKLERDLAQGNGYRASSLVEIFISERNTLHLEFSSINAAGSAFVILTSRMPYRLLEICFERDPCAGHLHELDWDIPPRPPILPRGRKASPEPQIIACTSFNHRRDRSADGNDNNDAGMPQCKRLVALQNQKISIPSFSGAGIQSSSWADEVNDEFDLPQAPSTHTESKEPHSTVPPNSPCDGSDVIDVVMIEDINQAMTSSHFRKPPVGLAGSKYASLVPGFEDRMAGSKARNLSEKLSGSLLMQETTGIAGVTPIMVAVSYDEETSESERSYSQTATRVLAALEEKQLNNKSSPRVNLASLLASPPSSPTALSLSPPAPTILPPDSFANDELQPVVISTVKSDEKRTTYPTPDTSTKKYIVAEPCTESETQTPLAGLNAKGKKVLGEMVVEEPKAQDREFSDFYSAKFLDQKARKIDLLNSLLDLSPTNHANAVLKNNIVHPHSELQIPITPDNQLAGCPKSPPLNTDIETPVSLATSSEHPLPEIIHAEFQRGQEIVLREDPFGYPISIPPSESATKGKWSERTPLTVGIGNPDEITLDEDDDDIDDGKTVKMLKPREEGGEDGKINVTEKNAGEALNTPSRERLVGKGFF